MLSRVQGNAASRIVIDTWIANIAGREREREFTASIV